jgi:hypothetical protein
MATPPPKHESSLILEERGKEKRAKKGRKAAKEDLMSYTVEK